MINIFLYLQNKKGKKIPLEYKLLNDLPLTENDLIVNDYLDLSYSNITYLPDNLTVNSDLFLAYSNIISLPNNLTVNGWLDLEKTKIKSLPNNLTVNGYLDITKSKISVLPDDLIVNGSLWCHRTPLANNIKNVPSLLNKYQNLIKGTLYYD